MVVKDSYISSCVQACSVTPPNKVISVPAGMSLFARRHCGEGSNPLPFVMCTQFSIVKTGALFLHPPLSIPVHPSGQ